MKRNLLLSAVGLFFAASISAQTDVTPSRYVFSDLSVGSYAIDNAVNSANPPIGYADAVDNFNNGYIIINNGSWQTGQMDHANVKAITDAMSIVDLGGEVGKVFCMKGKDSTFPYGTTASSGVNIGWWNMSFYTDKANVAKEEKVRFSIVFKIIENNPDIINGSVAFDAYTYQGDNLFNPTSKRTIHSSSNFIQRWEDDNSPMEDEDGNYMYDDDLWQKFEFDYQAGEANGIPLRFMMAFSNQSPKFNNSTLLIKSLTLIKGAQGEPVNEALRFKMDPSTTGIVENNVAEKAYYSIEGSNVTFHNLTVGDNAYVYTTDGRCIKSFVAGVVNTISLEKGLYFVKSGAQSLKVAVQ